MKLTDLNEWQQNLICIYEAYRRLGFTRDQIHFVQQTNPTVERGGKPVYEILVTLYLTPYSADKNPDFATTVGYFAQDQTTIAELAEQIGAASDVWNSAEEEEAADLFQTWGARLGFPPEKSPFMALAIAIAEKGVPMPGVERALAYRTAN